MPDGSRVAALRADLTRWAPADPAQGALRDEYLDFVTTGSLDRGYGPQHVTASCFVLSPDRTRVLLCFHRKGQFWVQLGGHIEPGDPTVAAAALREAVEEGGIAGLAPVGSVPFDVDRHGLGDGFGACAVHWDVGYVAIAPSDAVPTSSDESEEVAWWPVDALPANVPPGFPARLAGVLVELASRS